MPRAPRPRPLLALQCIASPEASFRLCHALYFQIGPFVVLCRLPSSRLDFGR